MAIFYGICVYICGIGLKYATGNVYTYFVKTGDNAVLQTIEFLFK